MSPPKRFYWIVEYHPANREFVRFGPFETNTQMVHKLADLVESRIAEEMFDVGVVKLHLPIGTDVIAHARALMEPGGVA